MFSGLQCFIGVGAQSTLAVHNIFARKYVWKIILKMPEFNIILAQKIIKIPEFLCYLSEKLTKFPNFIWVLPPNARILHNNWPNNIFPDFFFGGGRGGVPPASVSYRPTPMHCWENAFVGCTLCLYIWLGFWGLHPPTDHHRSSAPILRWVNKSSRICAHLHISKLWLRYCAGPGKLFDRVSCGRRRRKFSVDSPPACPALLNANVCTCV